MKKNICIVTGTRAEYGLLYTLMKELQSDHEFDLQIIATGMHLSPEFGLTYKAIEEDGFIINDKIELLLSSDSSIGVAKSMGLGTISFAESYQRLNPDLLIVLGDRFEILAAVQSALVMQIPIAHIAGGDTTEGAYDESIRHSITKMSHIHFVTNTVAAKRVKQLGENPANVFCVGNPGIDYIKRTPMMSKRELEKELNFKFREKNILVTFHPVTLDEQSSSEQFSKILIALEKLLEENDFGIIITKPNADNEGRVLMNMIDNFCSGKHKVKSFTSLGQKRYLSTVNYVDVVVGNSSSGLCEVPTFKKPTVNVGDRQKGRLRSESVIDCKVQSDEIYNAIIKAIDMDCSNITNPYGDGNSSKKIVEHLKQYSNFKSLLQKHFYEVGYE